MIQVSNNWDQFQSSPKGTHPVLVALTTSLTALTNISRSPSLVSTTHSIPTDGLIFHSNLSPSDFETVSSPLCLWSMPIAVKSLTQTNLHVKVLCHTRTHDWPSSQAPWELVPQQDAWLTFKPSNIDTTSHGAWHEGWEGELLIMELDWRVLVGGGYIITVRHPGVPIFFILIKWYKLRILVIAKTKVNACLERKKLFYKRWWHFSVEINW